MPKITRKQFDHLASFLDRFDVVYPDSKTEFYAIDRQGGRTVFVVLGEPGLRSCVLKDAQVTSEQMDDPDVAPIYTESDFKWALYCHLHQ